MYKLFVENGETMNGKILFEALSDNCSCSQNVFNNYADYLAEALISIIKVFDPEIEVLSGGITKEDDAFLAPIVKRVKKIFLLKFRFYKMMLEF